VALPVTTMDDAVARYGPGTTGGPPPSGTNTPYCVGDQLLYEDIVASSYIVRAPDDTPADSLDNPVVDGCVRTYSGRNVSGTGIYDRLRQSTSYDQPGEQGFEGVPFGDHFRRWATICTIPPGEVVEGDYLIQVRNNPDTSALPGSALDADDSVLPGSLNRIALRSGFGSAGAPDGSGVVVEPVDHVAWGINAGTTTERPLVRVPSAHAGETVEVEIFDVGDPPGGTVTIDVLPPVESGLLAFADCSAHRDGTPNLTPPVTGCGVAGMVGQVYSGRVLTMAVPIPVDYTCDDEDLAGCLVRLSVTFAGGAEPIDTFTTNVAAAPAP
jgi:hypothetical protein